MKRTRLFIFTLLIFGLFSLQAYSSQHTTNMVGVNGYDLVSYHTEKRPLRGNGNYTATHDAVTYLFSSEENKDTFKKNPGKYIPAYGGWCAFGVAVGKKFSADPEVWEIVDGRLYLNLDQGIKKEWRKDIKGNIIKANSHWSDIKDKSPSEL